MPSFIPETSSLSFFSSQFGYSFIDFIDLFKKTPFRFIDFWRGAVFNLIDFSSVIACLQFKDNIPLSSVLYDFC